MTKTIRTTFSSPLTLWRHALPSLLLGALLASSGSAQIMSVFDGATPAGVAPGTPAGSYTLSGFEHYNPFSGGFAPVLPLYHVGGRGEAGFDLVWRFQPNWAAYKQFAGNSVSVAVDPYPSTNIVGASNNVGLGGAGVVYARTGATYTNCGMYYPSTPATTVTRLVFLTGTGTEINLTDQATNGNPYTINPPCTTSWSTVDAGRGTTFHSTDGSQLQFTADAPVLETNPNGVTHGSALVSGTLQFPNGVTYRIDSSTVSWMRDRNGNQITLNYGGPAVHVTWFFSVPSLTQIIDANNRTITINYSDNSCGGCATITYPGANRSSHVLQIATTSLGNVLRNGSSLQTIDGLFPGTGQPPLSYTPTVASAVRLPDGSQYSFQYNSYGELARVTLPTGGAVEYDYGDGFNGTGSGFQGSSTDANGVLIYRRLQERREYAAGGAAQTARTHYMVSYPGGGTADTQTSYDPSGATLTKTVHTYNGSPLDALTLTGTGCNAGNEGLETKTESGTPTVLRTVTNTWAPQSGCQNNPQLQAQTTTLNDTNQVSQVTFGYDAYNNVTDQKEYDWGTGAPGALLRETTTVYLWQAAPEYAQPSVNLVHLPFYTIWYDGSGQEQARTVYYYDQP